jgi:hypothetical protein
MKIPDHGRARLYAMAVVIAGNAILTLSESKAQTTPVAKKPAITIAEHLKRVREFVGRQEVAAKGKKWNFTSVSDEELAKKLDRIHSPMIVFQGWSASTNAGGSINYTVGIYNPDPVERTSVYAHVFVGPANLIADVATALLAVDPRYSRLTMPEFFGLTIPSGGTESLSFEVAVPSGIQPSNYLGNTFLFEASYHDVGTYFDRSVFPFKVQ